MPRGLLEAGQPHLTEPGIIIVMSGKLECSLGNCTLRAPWRWLVKHGISRGKIRRYPVREPLNLRVKKTKVM